jgi:hypothetical protein
LIEIIELKGKQHSKPFFGATHLLITKTPFKKALFSFHTRYVFASSPNQQNRLICQFKISGICFEHTLNVELINRTTIFKIHQSKKQHLWKILW